MFTGIVRELGSVRNLVKVTDIYRFDIESGDIYKAVEVGDSLSVNGVCLTLVAKKGNVLSFEVMEETMSRSNLKDLRYDDKVNLEGSLKTGGTVDGHFVLGHIDCIGRLRGIKKGKEFSMEVEFPGKFKHLVVEKGSIAIDGVSLTVGEVRANILRIYLIPHTLKSTTLAFKRAGDALNIEFDIIGKYVTRFKEEDGSRISEGMLRQKGFI